MFLCFLFIFISEARSLTGIAYYEQKDDPRFLPLDDDYSLSFDTIDMLSDRDDLVDFLEPGLPRVRAYTLDNSCTFPSKFKADDSWITLPQSDASSNILQIKKQDQGVKKEANEKLIPCNLAPTSSVANEIRSSTISISTTALTSVSIKPIASTTGSQPPNKEELGSKMLSVTQTKTHGVSSTTEARCLDVLDLSLKTPVGTLKMANDSSKMSASLVSTAVSSSDESSKETAGKTEDQAKIPCEYGQNNNNNYEAVGEGIPVPYVKDDIPWNPGNVRKQREKMEEQLKSGMKTGAEGETVTEDDGATLEVLKKDEETTISDHYPHPEQASFSVMHSSPQKLKTSHSFSSFPVSGDEAQKTPAGGGSVCDVVPTAERPQSVCLLSSSKDLLGTLGETQKDSLASVQEPSVSMLPLSVYEMEDINLPAGIVRRTTKELEEKHR